MDMNDQTEAPQKVSLADLAAGLEEARTMLAQYQVEYERAGKNVKAAVEAERNAYKAFQDAVREMRPKRAKREPKPAGEAKTKKAKKS